MFADDTRLSNQSNKISQLNEVIKEDLKQVDKWLNANKLSHSVLRTHSMLISTKPEHKALESNSESLKLKIRENDLEAVQKLNILVYKLITLQIGRSILRQFRSRSQRQLVF